MSKARNNMTDRELIIDIHGKVCALEVHNKNNRFLAVTSICCSGLMFVFMTLAFGENFVNFMKGGDYVQENYTVSSIATCEGGREGHLFEVEKGLSEEGTIYPFLCADRLDSWLF